MTFPRIRTGLLCASLSLFATAFAPQAFGQEPAPRSEPRIIRVRVLGLFSSARVEALREAAASIEDAALKDVDYETAHATFEVRPDKAWKDVPAEKLPERIDQALRQASRSTFSAAPASETPAERIEEVTIAAGGCACRACELAAYEAVAKVEGVERATVSFTDSSVIVRFDREKSNRAALEAALKQRGVTLLLPTP
jgi:mercuric ion binding protein